MERLVGLEVDVGTRMEKALWVSFVLAFPTISSSFKMHRLELLPEVKMKLRVKARTDP